VAGCELVGGGVFATDIFAAEFLAVGVVAAGVVAVIETGTGAV
jgi:hypothetical protein